MVFLSFDGHEINRNRQNGICYCTAGQQKHFLKRLEDDDAREPEALVFFPYPISGDKQVVVDLAQRSVRQLNEAGKDFDGVINGLVDLARRLEECNTPKKKAEARQAAKPAAKKKAKPSKKGKVKQKRAKVA